MAGRLYLGLLSHVPGAGSMWLRYVKGSFGQPSGMEAKDDRLLMSTVDETQEPGMPLGCLLCLTQFQLLILQVRELILRELG